MKISEGVLQDCEGVLKRHGTKTSRERNPILHTSRLENSYKFESRNSNLNCPLQKINLQRIQCDQKKEDQVR